MTEIDSTVVVITGASSGIGRATAFHLARQQGSVVLIARQEKALRELAAECEEMGAEALAMPADVTDPEEMEQCARQAVETFGRIDAWVNNAAVSLFGRFEEVPLEDFRQVIETNLFGYVHGARAVLPYFREQGRGLLINVSSVVAKSGQPLTSAYATSKSAIDGFSESLRMELEDAPGIRVCTVHAASIDTPLFQHAANFTGWKVKPLEPVYPAEQVAEAILRCIERPRRGVTVGGAGRGLTFLRRVAPGATTKALAKAVPEQHLSGRRARFSHGNLFKPRRSDNRVSGGWRGEDEQRSRAGPIAAAAIALAGAGAGTAAWMLSRRRNRTVRKVERAMQPTGRAAKGATSRARRAVSGMRNRVGLGR